MMGDFDGKRVVVLYREERIVRLDEDVEILSDTPEGTTVRYTYRKGKRLEFIPRDKLESILFDEKKSRKPKKAKEAAQKPEPKPEVTPPVAEAEDTGSSGVYQDPDEDFEDDDEFE